MATLVGAFVPSTISASERGRSPAIRTDIVNLFLIVASCAIAHVAPLKLLAFSYAILGPGHYLTEIAWLDKRGYFSPRKAFPIFAAAISVSLVTVAFLPMGIVSMPLSATLLAVGMGGSVVMAGVDRRSTLVGVGMAVCVSVLVWNAGWAAQTVTVLLPTVVHVFVFTALFMMAGARRANSKYGRAGMWTLVGGAASFIVLPTAHLVADNQPILQLFVPVADMLSPGWDTRSAFGFLAFAYTYHYLNWFSKVEVIRWHAVSTKAKATMSIMYAGLLGVYLWSFAWGLRVSLLLSVLHIVCEFPLNWRTITDLTVTRREEVNPRQVG